MGEDKQQTSLHFFDSEKVPVLKEICLKSVEKNRESEILLKKIEEYIAEKRGKRE